MLDRIRNLVKGKARAERPVVLVRTEYFGDEGENKTNGKKVRVLVARGDRALVARVLYEGKTWAIEVDPPVPPVEFPRTAGDGDSLFAFRTVPRPRTRVQAVALAAAHLATYLAEVER